MLLATERTKRHSCVADLCLHRTCQRASMLIDAVVHMTRIHVAQVSVVFGSLEVNAMRALAILLLPAIQESNVCEGVLPVGAVGRWVVEVLDWGLSWRV